jgi:hypothetical protein
MDRTASLGGPNNEATKFRHATPFFLKLAALELVRGDEDEWPWHRGLLAFAIRSIVRLQRLASDPVRFSSGDPQER